MNSLDIATAALADHFPEEIGLEGLPAQPDLNVIRAQSASAGDEHSEQVAGLTAIITDMSFALSGKDGYSPDARQVLNRFSNSAAYRAHFKALA
jgi:hypothetical protein